MSDGTLPAVDQDVALRVSSLCKSYGGSTVLDDVNFDLRRGEVHALLGANGAGKSTLIKILAGVVGADHGTVEVGGHTLPRRHKPADVTGAGLAFVHQDLGLMEHLSVAENLALTAGYSTRLGLIRFAETNAHARDLLHGLGLDLDPEELVGRLAQDQKVMVAVARAFALDAGAVVLDEVSSSLPAPEASRLLTSLRASTRTGKAYVYVTHRLEEVFGLADRVTVLRNGRVVGSARTATVSQDDLVEWIVGSSVAHNALRAARSARPGQEARTPRLKVRDLLVPGLTAPVDFDVDRGEIVGLCGLIGSGPRAVAAALGGALRPSSGGAILDDRPLPLGRPVALRAAGCAYVPGDRGAEGAIGAMSIRENLFLSKPAAGGRRPALRTARREGPVALRLADRVDVRPVGSVERPLSDLSGGNQQKVIVGRALGRQPDLLVLEDPTTGVDVGSRLTIHHLIRAAADAGAAVVVASSDYEEVASLADRAIVYVAGKQGATLRGEALTHEALAAASYAIAATGTEA